MRLLWSIYYKIYRPKTIYGKARMYVRLGLVDAFIQLSDKVLYN